MSLFNSKYIKKACLGGFVLAAFAIPANIVQVSAWPMFMHDPQHTSQSDHSPGSRLNLEWTLPLELSVTAAPVIGLNNNIFIGSTDNNLYSIDPDGEIEWRYETNGPIYASPAVDGIGNVYTGSADQHFYSINRNGQLNWEHDLGSTVNSSPTIIHPLTPTTIYQTTQNGQLHSFYSTGSNNWSTDPLQYGISFSSPAVMHDNKIAVSTLGRSLSWSSGKLYVINPNGSTHCSYDTGFYQGNGARNSVSITSDNNIVMATKDSMSWGPGRLFIIDQDCNHVCHTGDINHLYSSPAITEDGTIYIGTDNGLYAFNESCQTQWTAYTGSITYSTPAIANNGKIYVGSDNGNLYAITPDGDIDWQYDLEEQLGSPIIGANGQLYINSATNLYAFNNRFTRHFLAR